MGKASKKHQQNAVGQRGRASTRTGTGAETGARDGAAKGASARAAAGKTAAGLLKATSSISTAGGLKRKLVTSKLSERAARVALLQEKHTQIQKSLHRQKLGPMRAMASELDEVLAEVTAGAVATIGAEAPQVSLAAPALEGGFRKLKKKRTNRLRNDEIAQFQAVLSDQDFLQNPFAAVAVHLQNTVSDVAGSGGV